MVMVVVEIINTSFVSIVPFKKLTFPDHVDNDYDYIVGDIIRWSRCDTKNIGLTMLCKFDGDVPLPAVWSHQVKKTGYWSHQVLKARVFAKFQKKIYQRPLCFIKVSLV